jgi:hypothetical protein
MFDLITKYYTFQTNKKQVTWFKPYPLVFKSTNKAFVKPIYSVKFYQPNILDLEKIIKNEQMKKQKKTLVDLFEAEKKTNKQKNEIKLEDVIGVGIVGLGLWALYTYSGYKISFVPFQLKY